MNKTKKSPIKKAAVRFIVGPKEIMRLDKKGMFYEGKYIKDTGRAYNAFMEVMKKMKEIQSHERPD